MLCLVPNHDGLEVNESYITLSRNNVKQCKNYLEHVRNLSRHKADYRARQELPFAVLPTCLILRGTAGGRHLFHLLISLNHVLSAE